MGALIRVGVLFGIVCLGTSYILYQWLNGRLTGRKVDSRLKKDIKALRKYLRGFKAELVPLTHEEIHQLSLSFKENIRYSRFKGVYTGTVGTIYHEPLAHFTAKYYPKEDQGVLVLRTAEDEIGYVFAPNKTTVLLNGKRYGVIDKDFVLWSQLTKQRLAHLEKSIGKHHELYINNKKLAHVYDPKSLDLNNMRAFDMVQEHPLHEQRDFLILSLFFLLEKFVP